MQQSIQWRRVGQVVVVQAQKLTLLHEDSREVLDRVVAENPGCDMVLNCQDITYISSSAFGPILRVYKRLRQTGQQLILASFQPAILDVLRMTRLDQMLTVVPDEKTALSLLAGAKARSSATVENG